MLSLYLRFMLKFIFIIYCIFDLIKADNSSSRNQCQSHWHYLSDESTCIIFATSQAGDVSWYDGYKACQTSSAQLLTLTDSIKFQLIQEKLNNNEIYLDYIQRGAWIGEVSKNIEWSNDDLCDSTTEDLQLNCIILTVRSDDQILCLKKVSCGENHPFICQNTAMTERELIESTMERLTWWKCIILIWCLIDDKLEKDKKKQEALAAEAANLQAYINQFNFDIPKELEVNPNAHSLMNPTGDKLMISGYAVPNWMIIVVGGFIFLLMICMCCTAIICIFININSGRSGQNRDGSFESTYSTVSR